MQDNVTSVSQYRHVLSLKKKKLQLQPIGKHAIFSIRKRFGSSEVKGQNTMYLGNQVSMQKNKFGALPSNSISQYTACFSYESLTATLNHQLSSLWSWILIKVQICEVTINSSVKTDQK